MNGTPWTTAEIRQLRRLVAARQPYAVIAAQLGRSYCAVRTYGQRHGLALRTRWTPAEIATLRRLWSAGATVRAISRQLGRTDKAIQQAIGVYAARRYYSPELTRAERDQIRALNAEGYPDTRIAGVLGRDRHAISRARVALGLPSHAKGEHWRQSIRAAAHRQIDGLGLDSLGQLRSVVFAARAIQAGWPADLRPRAVQILNLLHDQGPQTRKQIAAALGMSWLGSRKSLRSQDPEGSYLAHLMARGLVVDLGRVVRQAGGKGHNAHLYALAPEVERHKPGVTSNHG